MKFLLLCSKILMVVFCLNYIWTGNGHTPTMILLLAVTAMTTLVKD